MALHSLVPRSPPFFALQSVFSVIITRKPILATFLLPYIIIIIECQIKNNKHGRPGDEARHHVQTSC